MQIKADDKAKELGATIDNCINWTWACGFKSEDIAKQFDEWCNSNGYETRGLYPQGDNTYNVRYR